MQHELEGAGKGDTPRPVSDSYSDNYERIFGKRELPREFKRFRITFDNEEKAESAPFIPNQEVIFNIGLGCYCPNNAMAVEKEAKKRGLIPIGDSRIPEPDSKKMFEGSSFKLVENAYLNARKLGSI